MIRNNLLLTGDDGYNLTKSLRFRSSASAYLNRTPSVSGSGTTFTWSGWVKRGILTGTNHQVLFSAGTGDAALTTLIFDYQTNQINFLSYNGSTNWQLITSAIYRDPSAWYHVVAVVDTTQATSTNRIKLYVNGTQITSFSTSLAPTVYPSQNYASPFVNQSGIAQFIGRWGTWNASHIFDGYMAEINFIDGQALTPSSFGSTNSLTGVWQPAKYTGTYGTNGFYLPFTNTTSTTTLGYDFSGNGNNWTTNNISLTSGSTYDSMTDVPTLTSATVANYCVLNPLVTPATTTLINGNLGLSGYTAYSSETGTIGVSSGKWYYEFVAQSNAMSGITGTPNGSYYPGQASNSYAWDSANTTKYSNNTGASYGAATSAGDIVGVAFDLDGGSITFYKNNVSQGTAYTFTPSGTYFPVVRNGSSTNTSVNFGQQGFTYTPPTGYVALNTYNLPTSTIVKGNTVMDATLWAGNNSTQSITNSASFQPDLVWLKNRTNAFTHLLYDSVRGVGTLKAISSSETSAEGGLSDNSTYGYLSAINSNGFTVVSGSTANSYTNSSSNNYVGWQWQAGQGTTSSNTNGSITSTVSVNATAGFSIVNWTYSNTNQTVGHGLGVVPKMIITKTRASANNWVVWHNYFDASVGNYLNLNTTSGTASFSTVWGQVNPTSTTFGQGSGLSVNGQDNIAYCWAEIAGFSKFGSYTGNGSTDGPFVYLGFRPKYVLVKNTDLVSGENWYVLDSARNTYNVANSGLFPNLSNAEGGSNVAEDLLSNGFKIRATGTPLNNSGSTYIYAAFAENPFKNALAR